MELPTGDAAIPSCSLRGAIQLEERQPPNERPEGQHQTTLYNVTETTSTALTVWFGCVPEFRAGLRKWP